MEYKYLPDISENIDSCRKPITAKDRIEGNIPYYGASGVVDYVRDYIFDEELLLVSEDGANLVMRSTPIAFSIAGKTWVNNHAHVLRFKDRELQAYVEYYLNHIDLSPYISGSAQPKLNQQMLNTIPIPVPSSEKIEKTVAVLDRIVSIKKRREKELEELDNLIKARFVELFGDPQNNPMGWDVVNISEVVGGKVSNGFFAKRDDYIDDGNVEVLGVANIVNRMYSKTDELPRTNANDRDIEKFEVKYGDMLFCRSSLVAEGIGKASIIPEDVQKNILFECHVIRLPLDLSKCVPEFMQTLSTMDYFRNQVIAQSKTATMTTIGQDGILKTDIILPPVDKQREFYSFVKQVDKSKVAVQRAMDETKILFDSLMQDYFG